MSGDLKNLFKLLFRVFKFFFPYALLAVALFGVFYVINNVILVN